MLKLTNNVMNRLGGILVLLLTLISSSCEKLSGFWNNEEKEPEPIPVSMVFDGVYLEVNQPDRTHSQFYLRKHSFSFFIRTSFPEGRIVLRLLISSGDGFDLNKWYSLPSAETENVWQSFGEIEWDRYYHGSEDDLRAVTGRVLFTEFNQIGDLNYCGEGYCTIKGEFEITVASNKLPENTIEIKNGKFYVPRSNYWDSSAMEE